MRTYVQKWGNSLGLRIPRAFALEAGLAERTAVDLTVVDGRLVVTAVSEQSYTLDELLSQVTPDNLHGEWDTGRAVGAESW